MMEQQVNYPCETLIAFPQVDRHDLAASAIVTLGRGLPRRTAVVDPRRTEVETIARFSAPC